MPPACLGGGTGRRAGLKIRFRKECRFDSDPRHQLNDFLSPFGCVQFMNICAKATQPLIFILSLLGSSYSFAQSPPDASGPVLSLSMGNSLGFSQNPLGLDSDLYGDWSVQGVATGLSFRQTNPVASNGSDYSGFSNAQMVVQKTSGPIQLLVQTGLYAMPTLGAPYVRAQTATESSYDYLPQAYVSITPNENWALSIGKMAALGGAESPFTFQNMNIQRGLLWAQTNVITEGTQLNFSDDIYSASFVWNNGAYSDVYNWLGGSFGLKTGDNSNLTLSWTGAVSGNAQNTTVTPLLQNNSQITNLIYQYQNDRWSVMPYMQYTYVPMNTAIGINGQSQSLGFALLSAYHVTPLQNGAAPKFHVSIPTRFEYQSSYGNSQVASIPGGLMYGPGSAAWSGTLTPTLQWDKVFARGEFSYVKAFNPLAGAGFGANGMNNNQIRLLIEAGLLF